MTVRRVRSRARHPSREPTRGGASSIVVAHFEPETDASLHESALRALAAEHETWVARWRWRVCALALSILTASLVAPIVLHASSDAAKPRTPPFADRRRETAAAVPSAMSLAPKPASTRPEDAPRPPPAAAPSSAVPAPKPRPRVPRVPRTLDGVDIETPLIAD